MKPKAASNLKRLSNINIKNEISQRIFKKLLCKFKLINLEDNGFFNNIPSTNHNKSVLMNDTSHQMQNMSISYPFINNNNTPNTTNSNNNNKYDMLNLKLQDSESSSLPLERSLLNSSVKEDQMPQSSLFFMDKIKQELPPSSISL